ncbi:MAG TPA: hypothetical protein PKN36_06660 [bacterium]|nr:hypothetical protein [bacterium]
MKKEKILVGWAERNITPDRPVFLVGQFHPRISEYVDGPVTATAFAIGTETDYAVMVSCDLAVLNTDIRERCREAIREKLPGIDAARVILNATHTHSAPGTEKRRYPPEPQGVMTTSEYADFFIGKIVEAVSEAWNKRMESGVSWVYGHAVVGHNRRASYFDDISKRDGYKKHAGLVSHGTSRMYGQTNDPNFSHIEGYEDHGIDMLFTWDGNNNPTGVIINLACTSQEVENSPYLSADFWHEIRIDVRSRCGRDLFVLPQCSAAGDQSPHCLIYKKKEERMLRLRGLTMRQEIGRRVSNTVEDVMACARKEIITEAPFTHIVKNIRIKKRLVTDEELAVIKEELAELEKREPSGSQEEAIKRSGIARCQRAIRRYDKQKEHSFLEEELHVIRLGEAAFATNRFELYLDYGIRIKARSPFMQTFVVQLAAGGEYTATYLPTQRAIAGKSYGANIFDNEAGPEGGQQLVEETLKTLHELWNE